MPIGLPVDTAFAMPEITYRAVKSNGHYIAAIAGGE